ncbi:MAG TPA: ATP-binding protein [Candidatus Limnocylindrales bacterium]|nr:ATP-binding protein [Candidatus Limnocylindrales bacterium]
MDTQLPEGAYIVAVSGGLDSMLLLDLLAAQKHLDLVVAHFDHGMRPDSRLDCEFVARAAKHYDYRLCQKQGS